MKSKIELSADEIKVIENLRAEKARKEAEDKELARQAAESKDLEEKFRAALALAEGEINRCINMARENLRTAVFISERDGIPFSSSVVDMGRSRQYIPKSFQSKWGNLDSEILECEFDIYDLTPGWEYWNTSSLRC